MNNEMKNTEEKENEDVQSRDDNVNEYDQEDSKKLHLRPLASTSQQCSQRQPSKDAENSASKSATPSRGRSRGRGRSRSRGRGRGRSRSRGGMKQQHEDIIQTNWTYLLKEIDAKDLKDHMFEKNILDQDDLDEIRSEKTRKKRTETFMNKLLRAGPDAYDVFIAALEKAGYNQAVEKLKKGFV
ncbi:caspase-2-like [Gigantopelta aegis]|uniref:caspase-2-like n=1 Tax=Gigantopelta aegis TaxID=1735272 RepID=UPI001B88E57B|nr:caspase-2-like [Gigantopelta aegis]